MIFLKKHSSKSEQSSKDKQDTCDDPGRDGGEALDVGGVGGDVGEDVDQDEEEGDE